MKVIVVLFLCFAFAKANFWTPCSDSIGVLPDLVESPSCSNTQCEGVRGGRLVADIFFTPRNDHNDLRVDVWAYILGLRVMLPSEPPHDNVRK
jgi:hypothetical protein